MVRVDDLEAAFDAVTKAGGVIAKPIFSFPGGRRFHFIDPSGSELAVWSDDARAGELRPTGCAPTRSATVSTRGSFAKIDRKSAGARRAPRGRA